jgi:hypothetical protein
MVAVLVLAVHASPEKATMWMVADLVLAVHGCPEKPKIRMVVVLAVDGYLEKPNRQRQTVVDAVVGAVVDAVVDAVAAPLDDAATRLLLRIHRASY